MARPVNADTVEIERHRHPARRTWDVVNGIYRASFADDLREPEAIIEDRVATGRYRLIVAAIADEVVGFAVLDIVPEPAYAVLSYLAVAETYRDNGIGGALCGAVVSEFHGSGAASWLLVEAECRQAVFYRSRGFQAFALDYRAPRFGNETSIAMSLMAVSGQAEKRAASRLELCDIIRHLFVDGYALNAKDPRLLAQLAAITDPTPLVD